MILVWIAALFFRLRLIESETARHEFRSLAALRSLSKLPFHEIFVGGSGRWPYGFELSAHLEVREPLINWLEKEHPDIDRRRVDARMQITKWLLAIGVPESDIIKATGKGNQDSLPFLFFRTPLPDRSSSFLQESELKDNPPVGLLLDETAYWGDTQLLEIVTKVDEKALPKQFGIRICDSRDQPEELSYFLRYVRVTGHNELTVSFEQLLDRADQVQPDIKNYNISVETTILNDSRWIDNISTKLHGDDLRELATDSELRSDLMTKYGGIRVQQALDLTSRRMLESFGDVKLLGFDFSPSSFWAFVFAFFTIFLAAVALHLANPYGEQKDEATTFGLHLFVEMLFARIILWIVVPVSALLLVMPVQSHGWDYWVCVVGVGLGGVFVTWRSTNSKTVPTAPS